MAEALARMAARVVRKFEREFLERAQIGLERDREGELHAARIAGKRLRYNLEFFRAALGDECGECLKLLALAQERLGAIADADALTEYYDELIDGLGPNDPRRTGIEALRVAARRQRRRALEQVEALWRGTADLRPYPERLAASISAALGSLSPKVS